jgi:hypothetical protein
MSTVEKQSVVHKNNMFCFIKNSLIILFFFLYEVDSKLRKATTNCIESLQNFHSRRTACDSCQE